MKFLEFTVELLTKQYEIAKIDEARDAVLIQVVEKAIPPDYKSKPKRALIVLMAVLAAGVLAIILAFLKEALEKARLDPQRARALESLKSHLSGRGAARRS